MATQPIDRQRFKHQLKQSRKPVGITEVEKERKWMQEMWQGKW